VRCCLTRTMSSSDADMHGVQFLNFFYANYVHLYGIIKFFGVHWVGMGSGGGRKQHVCNGDSECEVDV